MVRLTEENFGTFKGETVQKFTWETNSGITLSAISYGAIISSIKVPDQNNQSADIVLGFDDLESYVNRNIAYFGAAVGRCANRIGNAEFEIDGVTYNVAKNIGEHHLHGGVVGFDKVNWQTVVQDKKVVFSYYSKDMEEGYPGDLITSISYEVTDDGAFHMEFLSTCTKKTVVNLTNHSYFNLAGHDGGAQELYKHVISINSDRITETDSNSIPTGNFSKVGGTAFDFRIARKLGDVIGQGENYFDDNFCVTRNGDDNQALRFAARAFHPSSGRYLEVYSNQPGVQFYTGNGLPAPDQEAIEGKQGVGYRRHGALCFETQNYPDAVHHRNFPSPILVPGEVYCHKVKYVFGVQKEDVFSVIPA